MRTAQPVPAPLGSASAASQPLCHARRRGGQPTRGSHRSIMPDDLHGSYLRLRMWRVHAHGCTQVLDDLLGETSWRGGEGKVLSWENMGAKFFAGEGSPGLKRTGLSDIVGAGKCGDRTRNAILWIDSIRCSERKIRP